MRALLLAPGSREHSCPAPPHSSMPNSLAFLANLSSSQTPFLQKLGLPSNEHRGADRVPTRPTMGGPTAFSQNETLCRFPSLFLCTNNSGARPARTIRGLKAPGGTLKSRSPTPARAPAISSICAFEQRRHGHFEDPPCRHGFPACRPSRPACYTFNPASTSLRLREAVLF
jgi:hypothetical protein